MTVIVGRTEQEAQAKYEEYRSFISHRGALTLLAGWTGIDFSGYQLDDVLTHIRNDAINSAVDAFTIADPIANGPCVKSPSSSVSEEWVQS
jgi:alkanesulfonate monooxygenase